MLDREAARVSEPGPDGSMPLAPGLRRQVLLVARFRRHAAPGRAPAVECVSLRLAHWSEVPRLPSWSMPRAEVVSRLERLLGADGSLLEGLDENTRVPHQP